MSWRWRRQPHRNSARSRPFGPRGAVAGRGPARRGPARRGPAKKSAHAPALPFLANADLFGVPDTRRMLATSEHLLRLHLDRPTGGVAEIELPPFRGGGDPARWNGQAVSSGLLAEVPRPSGPGQALSHRQTSATLYKLALADSMVTRHETVQQNLTPAATARSGPIRCRVTAFSS
jgi:hypothetical protein